MAAELVEMSLLFHGSLIDRQDLLFQFYWGLIDAGAPENTFLRTPPSRPQCSVPFNPARARQCAVGGINV